MSEIGKASVCGGVCVGVMINREGNAALRATGSLSDPPSARRVEMSGFLPSIPPL
jgi:hypothetical protein